jgi:hypothetical protein
MTTNGRALYDRRKDTREGTYDLGTPEYWRQAIERDRALQAIFCDPVSLSMVTTWSTA